MTLTLDRVTVTRQGRPLLDDVSLALEPGQLLGLLGPNGAGKTTLLRVMLGLLKPERGRALVAGESIAQLSPRQRAAHIAWLPQHSQAAEELPALEVVLAARFRFDEPLAVAEREARGALERVALSSAAERPLGTLSGGERQRVALAGLLAQAAPILLVDEPANHLDPAQQIDVYRLLGELWREGRTLVCVTHDVNLLRHLGDAARVRVAGVRGGKLAFEQALTAPQLGPCLADLFGVQMREVPLESGRVLIPERGP